MVKHNKPDLVVWKKRKKICYVIDVCVPLDQNIQQNEKLRQDRYVALPVGLKKDTPWVYIYHRPNSPRSNRTRYKLSGEEFDNPWIREEWHSIAGTQIADESPCGVHEDHEVSNDSEVVKNLIWVIPDCTFRSLVVIMCFSVVLMSY